MQCNKFNVSFNAHSLSDSEHLEQAIDIMTLLLLSPVVTCSGLVCESTRLHTVYAGIL